MNYLIGGSINSGKIEALNGLIKRGEVKEEDIVHGDILRKELFDSLTPEEQIELFPKMHLIFNGHEKGIDLIQRIGIQKYLELEREESRVVFERKIQPLIDQMDSKTNKVIVGVQLLPEFIKESKSGSDILTSVFLIRDNIDQILHRESEYANESEGQRAYIDSLSKNKIQNGEAENQYLLHAKAKAEYGKMIKREIEDLGLDTVVVNTACDFNAKVKKVLEVVSA